MRAIVDAFYFIQLLRLRHQQFEPDAAAGARTASIPTGSTRSTGVFSRNHFGRRAICSNGLRSISGSRKVAAPEDRMSRMTLTGQRLVALFLLGCLLLNFPLLYLFERDLVIAGVPLLFVYVFVAWAALIVLLALVVERGGDDAE